ncbi:MAG: hypothetical protein WDW38_004947 [Sanguina aurantia]
MARLKAAEDEAARLRKELAGIQGEAPLPAPKVDAPKAKRVDGQSQRETLLFDLGGGNRAGQTVGEVRDKTAPDWLSERDVSFLMSEGPGESGSSVAAMAEAESESNRRLILGSIAGVALGAFALVPTQKLRIKPEKEMNAYIVPLLRIQGLWDESATEIINNAQWDQLDMMQSRVQRQPNNLRQSLDNCIGLIEDSRQQEKAGEVAAQLFEYVDRWAV